MIRVFVLALSFIYILKIRKKNMIVLLVVYYIHLKICINITYIYINIHYSKITRVQFPARFEVLKCSMQKPWTYWPTLKNSARRPRKLSHFWGWFQNAYTSRKKPRNPTATVDETQLITKFRGRVFFIGSRNRPLQAVTRKVVQCPAAIKHNGVRTSLKPISTI